MPTASSTLSWNMKSAGKRSALRFTAWLRTFVLCIPRVRRKVTPDREVIRPRERDLASLETRIAELSLAKGSAPCVATQGDAH